MAPQRKRWLVLGGLLALTCAAVVAVEQGPDAPVNAAAPARGKATPAPAARPAAAAAGRGAATTSEAAPALALDKLKREAPADPAADAFIARSWEAIAQAEKRKNEPPPPPPPPPAIPFTFMGKLVEAGQLTVFLAIKDRSFVAKPGETLDGAYKVEEVSDARVVFTYLPMNLRQELAIGGAP